MNFELQKKYIYRVKDSYRRWWPKPSPCLLVSVTFSLLHQSWL